MKILRYFLYFLLFLLLIPIVIILWPKGSLEQQMARKKVPAFAYGIIEDGAIKEIKVIGELEAGRAAPGNAIFNVASVTKPLFAVTMLKLIDAGVIGLDEPLHPYWVDEDIADDPRHQELTARIILSHQTGFPNWRWNLEDGKLAFQFDPGTQYQYSGEGFEYLKNAVQQKTGTALHELVDSLIFDPLDMRDAHMIWEDDMDESRFAKWHNSEGGQYEYPKRQRASAADDLMVTVEDYCKFGIHVMEGAGLSPELFQEMITAQVDVSKQVSYGLGWEMVQGLPKEEYALIHGGSDQGVRARVVLYPQSKRGFVLFTNGDKGQVLIDRQMVKKMPLGRKLIPKMYAPILWRIIYTPFF